MSVKKSVNTRSQINIGGKNVFFCADPHFRHGNIIKYSSRPFLLSPNKELLQQCKNRQDGSYDREEVKHIQPTLEEINLMDDTITNNINELVHKKDHLFILGDFGFFDSEEQLKEYRERINCDNLYLVWGNHDDQELFKSANEKYKLFNMIEESIFANIHGKMVYMHHYPMISWPHSHRGSIMLHGHVHGSLVEWFKHHAPSRLIIDVGVDCWDYKPISFYQLIEHISKLPKGDIDNI